MSGRPQPFVARKTPAAFSFAGYTLDPACGSLRRGAEEVKLRPRSYEALKYLIENAGRLVSKAELMTVLWPEIVNTGKTPIYNLIVELKEVTK